MCRSVLLIRLNNIMPTMKKNVWVSLRIILILLVIQKSLNLEMKHIYRKSLQGFRVFFAESFLSVCHYLYNCFIFFASFLWAYSFMTCFFFINCECFKVCHCVGIYIPLFFLLLFGDQNCRVFDFFHLRDFFDFFHLFRLTGHRIFMWVKKKL